MKASKIAAAVLAGLLALGLVALLTGLFQQLLISGARMARNMGDTVIIDDEEAVGEDDAAPTFPVLPATATWPPGDDPSWSEEMPQIPVDRTADELAEEMIDQ